jgi:alkylmercury lyase
MSLSETYLDHLATAFASSTSWERMTYFRPLTRLLAHGDPVSTEQLARALGRPEAEVSEALRQFEEIVFDERGRVVGAGLSLLPTPYRIEVQGHELFTWCALDTLIFPAWLGYPAQVSSTCPVTGTPIHLMVTPEGVEQLDPASAVVSLRMQEGLATCGNIREAFCAYSQFFASSEAASAWHALYPDGVVLSIAEAFTLGQKLTRLSTQRLSDGKRK